MAARFDLKSTMSGQFMFQLKGGNGKVILTSERYAQKAPALKGIESVKANAPSDNRYERTTAKDGRPYFVLKAASRDVIGKSRLYKTEQAMETGIASVKKIAPVARILDLS